MGCMHRCKTIPLLQNQLKGLTYCDHLHSNRVYILQVMKWVATLPNVLLASNFSLITVEELAYPGTLCNATIRDTGTLFSLA